MSIFDKLREPIFHKETSSAQCQLAQLEAVDRSRLPDELQNKLDREIKMVTLGIQGEKAIEFELRNSHMPMYVLHDLYLEHGGLSAQIDYLVITRGRNFVIECKNLYGNIKINEKGDFSRTNYHEEGIYSPVTQNQRHLELIKQIRSQEQSILTKASFERNFHNNYRSIIVLANSKTIVNDKYAPKEIKSQVIRADALIKHIRLTNENSVPLSDKQMERLANFFRNAHIERDVDYVEKYCSGYIKEQEPQSDTPVPDDDVICPRCGAAMTLRTAKKGKNAGKQFWGCSAYPKCTATIDLQ